MMNNVVRHIVLNPNQEIREIPLSKGSKILCIYVKHEKIYLAFEEDVNAFSSNVPKDKIEIAIFPENRSFIVDDYMFLGDASLNFGNTIYFVYYRNLH